MQIWGFSDYSWQNQHDPPPVFLMQLIFLFFCSLSSLIGFCCWWIKHICLAEFSGKANSIKVCNLSLRISSSKRFPLGLLLRAPESNPGCVFYFHSFSCFILSKCWYIWLYCNNNPTAQRQMTILCNLYTRYLHKSNNICRAVKKFIWWGKNIPHI